MQQHPGESYLSLCPGLWLQRPDEGGNAGRTAPLRSCPCGNGGQGEEMGLNLSLPLQCTEGTNVRHTRLPVPSWKGQSALQPCRKDLAGGPLNA